MILGDFSRFQREKHLEFLPLIKNWITSSKLTMTALWSHRLASEPLISSWLFILISAFHSLLSSTTFSQLSLLKLNWESSYFRKCFCSTNRSPPRLGKACASFWTHLEYFDGFVWKRTLLNWMREGQSVRCDLGWPWGRLGEEICLKNPLRTTKTRKKFSFPL